MKKTQIFQLVLLTTLFVSILVMMKGIDKREFGKSLNLLFGFHTPQSQQISPVHSASFARSARIISRGPTKKERNRELLKRSNIDKGKTKP